MLMISWFELMCLKSGVGGSCLNPEYKASISSGSPVSLPSSHSFLMMIISLNSYDRLNLTCFVHPFFSPIITILKMEIYYFIFGLSRDTLAPPVPDYHSDEVLGWNRQDISGRDSGH